MRVSAEIEAAASGMERIVLDGAIFDVAIGLLLIFLVVSLMGSAVVEAVGGLLHRRQKHLWDSLDLLLGNTSVAADEDAKKIVNELYKEPFITGLVRPNDRIWFDPASPAPERPPIRGRALAKNRKTRADNPELLARRYYGPGHIASREFANALLSYVRSGGTVDQLRQAISRIEELAKSSGRTVGVTGLEDSLHALDQVADDVGKGDLKAAVASIRAAGESIDQAGLEQALGKIRQSLGAVLSGSVADADYATLVALLPGDLRAKLGTIVADADGAFDSLRHGIEEWFDRNMAAASEWYRKQTRWFLFATGLVLAASLNVDVAHAAMTLYRDDETRTAVVALADQVAAVHCPTTDSADATSGAVTGAAEADDADGSTIDLQCVKDAVGDSIRLPIGWSGVDQTPGAWAIRLFAWVVVAAAVTLGGPFWFDLLGRAMNVRRPQGGTK